MKSKNNKLRKYYIVHCEDGKGVKELTSKQPPKNVPYTTLKIMHSKEFDEYSQQKAIFKDAKLVNISFSKLKNQ